VYLIEDKKDYTVKLGN